MVKDRHTHGQTDYCNPPAHAQRVNKYIIISPVLWLVNRDFFKLFVLPSDTKSAITFELDEVMEMVKNKTIGDTDSVRTTDEREMLEQLKE